MTNPLVTAVVAFSVLVSADSNVGSANQDQNAATQKYLKELNKSLGRSYLLALAAFTAAVYIYHSVLRINSHVRHMTSLNGNPGSQRYFATLGPWMSWLKDHLLLAPLLHHRRAKPIKFGRHVNFGGVPTRFQSLFLALIIFYNIFACVYNVPWSSPQLQVLPILRNRTGTIATINLVPILVMATIKNPLIHALEVSYDSFVLIHRWLGRIAILQGLAHTLCWLIAKVQQKGWSAVTSSFAHSEFIYTGLIATVGFLAIGLQSPKLFRALAYEFFLHFHIVLVAVTFAGLWYHLQGLPHQPYLLAAIIIWAAARGSRFANMIYRSCGRGGCKATVTVLPSDALRIEFLLPRPWKVKAGQSLYICLPSVGFWTSHPFSVAWSEALGVNQLSRSLSTRTKFEGVGDAEKRLTVQTTQLDVEANKGRQTVSLVVKKSDGFTRKLYDKVSSSPTQELSMTALVEGPYGHEKSLASYGTVLLFASGVGITHQMPYVKDLVHAYAEGTVAVKKITLVWVVPDTDSLEWVRPWMHEILAMTKRREVLRVLLYISRATLRHEIRSPSETVRMSRGRPDVLGIMCSAAEEQVGCMGVTVCAGGGLADEVRRASRFVVSQGVNLDLIEEGFGW